MFEESSHLERSRYDYHRSILLEEHAATHPVDQFQRWLADAETEGVKDYNAFTLATIGQDGFPNTRVVLLRKCDAQGLTFFTNYTSSKGQQLENNERVSMNFFWNTMERQVRIHGVARKVDAAESDAYFASRPRESQIAAWASIQSTEMRSREELEENITRYSQEFAGREVPRPPHWGGYRITPHYFEFWQGRPSRLHDRLVYRVDADFNWYIKRLMP
ncbi:MAG: pyridoxamine 5'-phosphate oxidase [Flavobacteriales bacterium]